MKSLTFEAVKSLLQTPKNVVIVPHVNPDGDAVGLIADSFVDPFAHVTIREHELLGISGNKLDYFTVRGTGAIDFRADNDNNFENLEKNSIDVYSSFKSIYLQDRDNKIKNSIDTQDDWGSLDN